MSYPKREDLLDKTSCRDVAGREEKVNLPRSTRPLPINAYRSVKKGHNRASRSQSHSYWFVTAASAYSRRWRRVGKAACPTELCCSGSSDQQDLGAIWHIASRPKDLVNASELLLSPARFAHRRLVVRIIPTRVPQRRCFSGSPGQARCGRKEMARTTWRKGWLVYLDGRSPWWAICSRGLDG